MPPEIGLSGPLLAGRVGASTSSAFTEGPADEFAKGATTGEFAAATTLLSRETTTGVILFWALGCVCCAGAFAAEAGFGCCCAANCAPEFVVCAAVCCCAGCDAGDGGAVCAAGCDIFAIVASSR